MTISSALFSPAYEAMPTPLQPAPEGRPRLLIVDDDTLIADTLSFALGAEFEVLACASRPHAIELLRQLAEPPQLALVDLGLPPPVPGEQALLRAQLRRDRADAGRADAVRPCQGGVHRRAGGQVRLLRGCARRHPVSGRDRRTAARDAGEAAAGAGKRRVSARGGNRAA